MKKWSLIWLVTLFVLVEPAVCLTKYGTARIRSGELIIVRDELESVYVPEDGEVEVLVNDVLRVGQDSFVVLSTREQTDIKMGSNAVFQIRPWKSRKKSGYLRMLYGKMSFKTKKLQKRKRFRFKTASATIGVRGTGAGCEVGSTGNTGCTGRSGRTVIQGNSGPSQELTSNRMSMVVGGRPASRTIEVTPEAESTGEADEGNALGKAAPTSSQSSSLSKEGEAVSGGIVEQADLEESKQEDVSVGESLDQELEEQSAGADDEEEGEVDEELEQDLKESEEDTLVAELEVSAPLDLPDVADVGDTGDTGPELPEVNVEDDIEDAVQESKNSKGRLILDFEK